MKRVALAFVAVAVSTGASAQDVAVRSLIDRFEAARLQYDPGALEKTLAPDYEEISPIGEVDDRAKVLGFYAPELKRPTPAMTNDEVTIYARGDVALATMRKSFALSGAARRSVRVRYVARRASGVWKLTSAQYTPIPPAKAP